MTLDVSMTTLSLEDNDTNIDDKLDIVRQSLLASNVDQFLATIGDIGDESPLVYLMNWFHTWQQEYEAFVHVLGVQIESGQEPNEMEKDLNEIENEAKQLMNGFSSVAMALLQRLGLQDPDSEIDRYGWTLLMQAANSGLYELTKELIARKADVNYGDKAKNASNPLYLALESEHTAVALLLLQNGAIASATKIVTTSSIEEDAEKEELEDDCALFQACRFGLVEVVKEMLALDVDINFALPSNGDRALHVSVMFEMQQVVALLLDNEKIELNAVNKSGQTCLFGCSSVPLVKLLVKKGVDPTVTDSDGETAFSMAQALGDVEVAEFLKTVSL